MNPENSFLHQENINPQPLFIPAEIFYNGFWHDRYDQKGHFTGPNNERVFCDPCCGKLYFQGEEIARFLIQAFGDGGLPVAKIIPLANINPEAKQALQETINYYGTLPGSNYSY